jgi:guanosine-diphosphatase
MFSRKYSPLPTSADGSRRKRAGGGLPTWKRYAFLGTCTILGVVLVYAFFGHPAPPQQTAPEVYTPNLPNTPVDTEEDFHSPPFRPTHDDEDEDSGEEQKLHILPVSTGKPDLEGDKTDVHFDEVSEEVDEDEEAASSHSSSSSSSSSSSKGASGDHPTSFESDRNPAGTTYCTKAYGNKPLVQYALTIDAGSTGSRIHAYKFHNCGPSPQLEYETFKQLQPGLSSFAKDPAAAAASLDPLMEEANRVVPESLHKCTAVEVKATAGLRLLGEVEAAAILDEVRNRLETKWPYVVSSDAKAIEIMEGKDEGVYAWITTNYLSGKIGEGVTTTDTLAVMDLGGASTQIVFEPKFESKKEDLHDGDHKYVLTFGGKTHTLYQHSHLNYGLMRARRRIHNLVAFSWSFVQPTDIWDSLSEEQQVPNPCLSHGMTRRVELDPPGRTAVNVTMHGGNGGYEACNRIVELALAKDAICEVQPCSFGGTYQPALIDTFKEGDFFALSYFTDRIQPLLHETEGASKLTVSDLREIAQDVCAGPDRWADRWGSNKLAMAELEDRPEYCLDLTFMHGLLGLGYEIEESRNLLVDKKIDGVELGWALGAGLALVSNAELKCLA